MRSSLCIVLIASLSTASAFTASPVAHVHSPAVATSPARVLPKPQMVLSLTAVASSVTTLLYAAMGLTAANGLFTKVPVLIGGGMAGAQIGDVAIDAILFCVAAVQLGKIAGFLGKVDYEKLEGLPKSYAFEAGERALAGEVSSVSKDGRYEVATFVSTQGLYPWTSCLLPALLAPAGSTR